MINLSDRTVAGLLVALQLAVCLPFINSFPIALDEPFSIFWAQQPMGEMISVVNQGNNSPLHFMFLHYWIKFFGIDPIAVRSLSLIFSLFSVVLIYFLAKKFLRTEFAVIAAIVFIFSKFMHFYNLEARMYPLLILEFTVIIYISYEMIFEGKFRWYVFIPCAVALLYTHYLGIIGLFAVSLCSLVFVGSISRNNRVFFLLSLVLVLILFLPGLLIFMDRFQDGSGSTWLSKPHWTELYGNVFRSFNNTLTFFLLVLIVLSPLIVKRFSGLSSSIRKFADRKFLFLLCLFSFPYFGMFIFSFLSSPIFLDRYLLFTFVPLYILFAQLFSFTYEARSNLNYLLVLVVAGVMTFSVEFTPQNNREPDKLAADAKRFLTKDAIICIIPPYFDLTFLYHFDRGAFSQMDSSKQKMDEMKIYPVYGLLDVSTKTHNYQRVILVDDNSKEVFPDNKIHEELSTWGKKIVETTYVAGANLQVYERN